MAKEAFPAVKKTSKPRKMSATMAPQPTPASAGHPTNVSNTSQAGKATANTELTEEVSATPVATAAPVISWTSSSTLAVVSSLKNARGGVFARRAIVQPEIVRRTKNGKIAIPMKYVCW
jgi:hypothetical protein